VRGAGGAATLGTCVAGELVAVDVEVSNPLQVREQGSEQPMGTCTEADLVAVEVFKPCNYATRQSTLSLVDSSATQ